MNEIDKILGKQYRMKKAGRDSDGDGVVNILDCQPYNPKKQGVIHRIGAAVLRKVGQDKLADKTEARGERVDKERAEVREVRREERQKQSLETAKFREEQRGESRRKFIKGGGFAAQLGRGLQTLSKASAQRTTRTVSKGKGRTKFVPIKGKPGQFKKVRTKSKGTKSEPAPRAGFNLYGGQSPKIPRMF